MLKDYFTAEEIAVILDVDLSSAQEILSGALEIEADEILELADYKGISTDNLLK